MKTSDISENWKVDCEIDETNLGKSAAQIPILLHKYISILMAERIRFEQLRGDYKILKLEKFEFFTQGPTKETIERGWELPYCGKVMKSEVANYLDADKDLIDVGIRLAAQKEKISFLESIVSQLNNRSFIIKNIQDWNRFINGG